MRVCAIPSPKDIDFMQLALGQARLAEQAGEVPVGAVLVLDDRVIATAYNQPIAHHDPSAHAEILAMRAGAKHLANYRLLDTTLYVTLEPCVMCAGAIIHGRVKRVVYGAFDPKAGAVVSVMSIFDQAALNHRVGHEGGVLEPECGQLLRDFFRARR